MGAFQSATVDGGGEDLTIAFTLAPGPLAGTPAVTIHRTPGVDLTPISTRISGSNLLISGVQAAGNVPSYIRNGEVVTIDVSGMTDNSVAIPAVLAKPVQNNSERNPRILGEFQAQVDENTPTTGNLAGPGDGYAKIFETSALAGAGTYVDPNSGSYDPDQNEYAHIPLVAEVQIRNGKWQYPQVLNVGVAYTVQFYDEANRYVNSKSFQM